MPYTRSWGSTTPPFSRGSIDAVPAVSRRRGGSDEKQLRRGRVSGAWMWEERAGVGVLTECGGHVFLEPGCDAAGSGGSASVPSQERTWGWRDGLPRISSSVFTFGPGLTSSTAGGKKSIRKRRV